MADATPRTPKTDQELRSAFIGKASARTSTAIRALAMVAKLPAKGRKEGDVQKIEDALEKALGTVKARLRAGVHAEPEFKLDK